MDNAESPPTDGKIARITEIHDELCSWIAVAETYTEQHYLQQAIISVKKIIEIANLKQEASEN